MVSKYHVLLILQPFACRCNTFIAIFLLLVAGPKGSAGVEDGATFGDLWGNMGLRMSPVRVSSRVFISENNQRLAVVWNLLTRSLIGFV
jgi:hypothetical protein